MKTEVKFINSNSGRMPLIVLKDAIFPVPTVEEFEGFCGAGDGFLNDIVPEKIMGIIISPACWNHDKMWAEAKPTWRDFHYSNSVFWTNINNLLLFQSRNKFLYHLRLYGAVTYFNAVDTIGAKIFQYMKGFVS